MTTFVYALTTLVNGSDAQSFISPFLSFSCHDSGSYPCPACGWVVIDWVCSVSPNNHIFRDAAFKMSHKLVKKWSELGLLSPPTLAHVYYYFCQSKRKTVNWLHNISPLFPKYQKTFPAFPKLFPSLVRVDGAADLLTGCFPVSWTGGLLAAFWLCEWVQSVEQGKLSWMACWLTDEVEVGGGWKLRLPGFETIETGWPTFHSSTSSFQCSIMT